MKEFELMSPRQAQEGLERLGLGKASQRKEFLSRSPPNRRERFGLTVKVLVRIVRAKEPQDAWQMLAEELEQQRFEIQQEQSKI